MAKDRSTKPASIDESEVWHREGDLSASMSHLVNELSRSFRRNLRRRLAAFDVQFSHWVLLRILWERDGLTQRELSRQAGVKPPTTLVALRGMEKLGLVEFRRQPDNRKNVCNYLTPKGRRLRSRLTPVLEELNAVALQGMSEPEIGVVRRRMLKMVENLQRDHDASIAPKEDEEA